MKYAFIAQYRKTWPIRTMCRVLQVSHSGFYDWVDRRPSRRDLQEWGYACSVNRVARLMRQIGLKARTKRRYHPNDGGVRPEHRVAPNLLDRQFVASAPNQRWVSDFTYIWTGEGWLYVAVVLDLYSRRVVGWSMSANMTAQLVMDALMMAIWRRGKPVSLMHHSDQGSQYVSLWHHLQHEPKRRLLG